jgi:putative FmdB family regulatory protein
MPIYEYQCQECGKVVEILTASVNDNAAPRGCSCGNGSHFTRLYSTFSAHAESPHEPHFASCGRENCCGGCALPDDD